MRSVSGPAQIHPFDSHEAGEDGHARDHEGLAQDVEDSALRGFADGHEEARRRELQAGREEGQHEDDHAARAELDERGIGAVERRHDGAGEELDHRGAEQADDRRRGDDDGGQALDPVDLPAP